MKLNYFTKVFLIKELSIGYELFMGQVLLQHGEMKEMFLFLI